MDTFIVIIYAPFVLALITGLVVFPLAAVGLFKETVYRIKNPISPRLIDNIFEVSMSFLMIILFILLEIAFIYMGYMLILSLGANQ